MATGKLYPQKDSVDEGLYSFPSTTDFLEFKGPNGNLFILVGTGAPSTDHNNAPTYVSLYIDRATGILYSKTGAAAWTKVSGT